jgi:K+-sensing histidine kinase KdpD
MRCVIINEIQGLKEEINNFTKDFAVEFQILESTDSSFIQDLSALDMIIYIPDYTLENLSVRIEPLKYSNCSLYIAVDPKESIDTSLLLQLSCVNFIQLPISFDQIRMYIDIHEKRNTPPQLPSESKLLQSIFQISSSVVSGGSIENFLQSLVDNAADTLNADRILLITLDTQAEIVTSLYEGGIESHQYKIPDFKDYYTELMDGLTGWVVRNIKSAYSSKEMKDERETAQVQQRRLNHQAGSIVVSPIVIKNQVYGTLTAIKNIAKRDFTTDEYNMVQAYTSFISIQIEKFILQKKLVEREKIGMLENFIQCFSHQLNTPLGNSIVLLTYIMDQLNDLESTLTHPKEVSEELSTFVSHTKEASFSIQKNLSNMKQYISEFRRMAILEEYDNSAIVDLQTIIQSVNSLKVEKHKISYTLQITPDQELALKSYPSAFFEIFSHLIENSIIHGFFKRKKDNKISINFKKVNGYIFFEYTDNGKGVEANKINKIFTPFYTSQLNMGFGLGLTRVKTIVEQVLNGQILARNINKSQLVIDIRIPSG